MAKIKSQNMLAANFIDITFHSQHSIMNHQLRNLVIESPFIKIKKINCVVPLEPLSTSQPKFKVK